MKKIIICIVIVIIISAAAVLATYNSQHRSVVKEDGFYISKYAKISVTEWENLNYKGNRFNSVDAFLMEVDDYVEAISSYLGKPDWLDYYKKKHSGEIELHITIKYSTFSYAVPGYIPEIYLGFDVFHHDRAPIAHEITHIIAPRYSSYSLSEGLASMMQDELGKNPALFNFGEPVHLLAKEILQESNLSVLEHIGAAGNIGRIRPKADPENFEKRRIFYILSHSFTKYLVDKYGIEKFKEVYDATTIEHGGAVLYGKYIEVYGKSLEELRELWALYIYSYEPSD